MSTHLFRIRHPSRLLATMLAAIGLIQPASGEDSFRPTKSVRIVVPYGAGGSVDAQARLLAEKLSATYDQVVIVDNRPGASGLIGALDVARAKPDGMTLLLTNTAVVQAPVTNPSAKFDPLRDVVPIAQVSLPQTLFVIDSQLPYKGLHEFIQAARQPNAKLSYGSAGYGQSLHLFGVMLNRAAGLRLLHVPYSGEAQVVNGLLGHQIDAAFLTVNASAPYIKSGAVRPLAALSSSRLAKLPDVQTFSDEGITGMDLVTFVGVFGPRGLPANIQLSINRDIVAALTSKEIQLRFDALDINPGSPLSAADFAKFVAAQYGMWKDIVAKEGIRTDDGPSAK